MSESRLVRVALAIIFTCAVLGCGKSPTGPSTPTPTPAPTYSVAVLVFVDDNGDGAQNPSEPAIVPDADVEIGGRTATSAEGTGGATITGIPAGTYPVNFKKLPPFFKAGVAKTITVPQTGGPLLLPATLPIADNVPGLVLSSGDSISQGDPGSSDLRGFRTPLEAKLQAAFLRSSMQYRGGGGLATDVGKGRILRDLRLLHPAYVLIDWGVNDWNPQPFEECQADPASPDCRMIDNLHSIIETVQGSFSLPCIATLTPPNKKLTTPQRYDWVLKANDLIRTLAKQDGALLVDVGDAFVKAGDSANIYYDEIHPNDAGYALMADTFFAAITKGTVSGASYDPPVLLPLTSSQAAASLTHRRR